MAIQKLQDNKVSLDKSLEGRRNVLKSDALTIASNAESIVTELHYNTQLARTDALNHVESCKTAPNDPLENTETPEVPGMELSKNDEICSLAPTKTNANETLDKGLKMLKEANQSALFLKLDDRLDNSFCQSQSATSGSRKRFFFVKLLPH